MHPAIAVVVVVVVIVVTYVIVLVIVLVVVVVVYRERLVLEMDQTGELLVDLGTDQTSCHNPFNGGYYPVQVCCCNCGI